VQGAPGAGADIMHRLRVARVGGGRKGGKDSRRLAGKDVGWRETLLRAVGA